MKLSVLIPSVFERDPSTLFKKLLFQIGDLPVEVIALVDNRKQGVGVKRNLMMDAAKGLFLTHLDDDDDIADDYISSILDAINTHPESDVIVYNQQCTLSGYTNFPTNPYIVRTGIEYENQECRAESGQWIDITRKPWHWCTWRTELAKTGRFPVKTAGADYGEDWYWLNQVIPKVKHQHRIDKVLHYYRYDKETTLY